MRIHDDERTAGRMKERRRELGREVCADLTVRLPVAYNESEYPKRDTLWFCHSVDEQTQRDNQRCDGEHSVVVARCLAVPQ